MTYSHVIQFNKTFHIGVRIKSKTMKISGTDIRHVTNYDEPNRNT